MSGGRALVALRWSFCAFIVWASAQTLIAALSGRGEPHLGIAHAALLAGVEILAALALLIPRAAAVAAYVLCGVFAIAATLTLVEGEAPLRFVYYAATVVLLGLADRKAPPSTA